MPHLFPCDQLTASPRSKSVQGASPRSGRQHKAWGASPRIVIKKTESAREATVLKVKLKLIRFSKGFDYGPLD
jgi:hypothetical protein